MDERTEDRIEGWDSKPLTGGFAELRELADGGFSGVVRGRGTTLYMLNGRVVGVFGGSIEDFADARATAYQAPHPSLPLLFAMKQYGGEQQAKYYTNDTPVSQAHNQLSDAQFTGYIELSENVLSGDYYVVYYGGRSMSCAFVGNSERLETGDEAFELADDEVGIYEVMSVDIEVTDIPEPGSGGGDAGGADAAGAGETPAATDAAEPGSSTGAEAGASEAGRGRAEQAGEGASSASAGASAGTADPATGAAGEATDAAAGAGSPDRTASSGAGDAATDTEAGSSTAGGGGAEPTPDRDPADGADSGHQAPGGGDSTQQPGGDAGPAASGGTSDGTAAGAEVSETGPAEGAGNPGGAVGGGADAADAGVADDPAGVSDDPVASAGGGTGAAGEPERPEPSGNADAAGAGGAVEETADPGAETEPGPQSEAAADRAVEAASGPEGSAATGAATAGEGVPKSEAAFGDLRPIPSLSPDHTEVAEPGAEAAAGRDGGGATRSEGGAGDGRSVGSTAAEPTSVGETTDRSGRAGSADHGGTDVTERATREVDVDVETDEPTEQVADDAGVSELRQQLQAREERIEELEAAITDLRVQRDGLTDERDRLATEVDRLEGEVEELEAEIDRLRSRLDDGNEGKQRLSREDALRGTNLFVRYDSKSGGTLDKAHGGEVDREEVNENLRLEHHTQFEADEVVVDGAPFEEFLTGTLSHGFVEWVVRDLLYEIQDTSHVRGLQELYDAVPRIDRAELLGDVSVEYTEDGEQYREQRSFDVVLRDRMGNPLIVANINDSRNPADREMMTTVIENGIDVKGSNESLSSAMMVTSSFFQPGALEAADEAAGGGLLSRDAKESYVKLNRKKGYHLILVESRDGDFHVNVPEL